MSPRVARALGPAALAVALLAPLPSCGTPPPVERRERPVPERFADRAMGAPRLRPSADGSPSPGVADPDAGPGASSADLDPVDLDSESGGPPGPGPAAGPEDDPAAAFRGPADGRRATDERPPPDPVRRLESPARSRPPAHHPDAVARLELALPRRTRFVLHGTLPVPPDLDLGPQGATPLALVPHDADTDPVPVQVEVVTRDPLGRPLVVEVLAPVERAAHERPGQRVAFDLVRLDGSLAATPAGPPAPRELLAPDGPGVFLRARDVFGNRYEAELTGHEHHPGHGGVRPERRGAAAESRRVAAVLVPVDPWPGDPEPTGAPLPHHLAVHAYWTRWADDPRLSLDLRVHNGLHHGNAAPTPLELPVGALYFESLELDLPEGWGAEALVADPGSGAPRAEGGRWVLPLVAPLEGGAHHLMLPQGQLQRRLAVVPTHQVGGPLDRPFLDGLAFAVGGEGLWSFETPGTDAYFAQRAPLTPWDEFRAPDGRRGLAELRREQTGQLQALRQRLERGEGDGNLVGPRMGWAQPWSYAHEGAAGGVDIQFVEGHKALGARSADAYERLLLIHRMNASRQPQALWSADGEVLGVERWLDGHDRVPFDSRTNGRVPPPDFRFPCLGGPAPNPVTREVLRRGLRPPYDLGTPHRTGGTLDGGEASLWNWMPHDGQHYVRWTKNPKALAWLGNDPLAKDDVRMAAELFRLMFHEHEHVEVAWSPGVTVTRFRQLAEQHPHQGLDLNRDHAWGIDAMCAAWALSDDAFRRRTRGWYDAVTDLLLLAAMPNGNVSRRFHPGIVGGRYDGCQTFEVMFLLHAQRCLVQSVLRGVDDGRADALDAQVLRTLDHVCWEPIWQRLKRPGGAGGDPVEVGPRFCWAVAEHDEYETPVFSDAERWGENYIPEDGFSGSVDRIYPYANLEYALSISPPGSGRGFSNRYLGRALQLWFAPGSPDRLRERMMRDAGNPSNDHSGNWVSFLGRLEALERARR